MTIAWIMISCALSFLHIWISVFRIREWVHAHDSLPRASNHPHHTNWSPSRDEKLIPQTQLEIDTQVSDITMRVLRFSDFTERLMLVGVFENKWFVVRCSDSEKNIKFLRIQYDCSFRFFPCEFIWNSNSIEVLPDNTHV